MKPTADELAEYRRRSDLARGDANLDDALSDPIWRLANLYRCKNDEGRDVAFIPSPEQETVIIAIFIRGWLRIIIPKARQLGMSLLLSLIGLDKVVFENGQEVSWIDKTGPDAEKKLKEKILFAWDRLDPALKGEMKETARNTTDFGVTLKHPLEGWTGSSYKAGITFRGGTVQMMVISEWGWVQAFDRLRSAEIKNGALPAIERAPEGLCVIETTWEGGLDGELGPLVKEAMETPEHLKGRKTWRILFFGWHTLPAYSREDGYVDETSAEYFKELETNHGIVLTRGQQLWYAQKRRTMTRVFAEYPSIETECWTSVVKGAIYGAEMVAARNEGRITTFLHDDKYPVHTFWDLGMPINTVCWYCQITPNEIRIIDVDMESEDNLAQRAEKMRGKPYVYGYHYLPWEAAGDHTAGSTESKMIAALGNNVRVVPKVQRVSDRIDAMRLHFSRFVFHSERCELGITHLERYRYDRETSSGITKLEPVHDMYSHAADALGQMPCAIEAGIVPRGGGVGPAVAVKPTMAGIRAKMAHRSRR